MVCVCVPLPHLVELAIKQVASYTPLTTKEAIEHFHNMPQ